MGKDAEKGTRTTTSPNGKTIDSIEGRTIVLEG
jgi:hypothetical protein